MSERIRPKEAGLHHTPRSSGVINLSNSNMTLKESMGPIRGPVSTTGSLFTHLITERREIQGAQTRLSKCFISCTCTCDSKDFLFI